MHKRYAWTTQGYVVVAVSILGDLVIILTSLAYLGIFKPHCKKASKAGEGVDEQCRHRVCYYPSWAHSRQGPARFLPENLDASLCSHIHYAYANLSGNRLLPLYSNDVNCSYSTKGMYFRINKLKRRHKGLKTLLSVGGWTMGSGPFTRMVRTRQSRQEFADTSAHFVDGHGFDGLELDWQYPGYGDSPPSDKEKFTYLVQQLRQTFDNYSTHSRPADSPLLLTAAVAPGNRDRIQTAYQLDKLHKLLDYMSVMTFDLHGPWQNVTGSLSPLYSRDNDSMDWAARYYSQGAGVPRSKLLLAISTFGRNFTLLNPSDASLGAPAVGCGREVRGTQEEGFLAYYQICKRKGEKRRNSKQTTPYLVNKQEWISFDDPVSVREKQLRQTFDNYSTHSRPADSPLLLTAAVAPGNRDRIQTAYQLDKLHKLLDYMSVMTFDLHGPWQNVTGSLSPLYSRDNDSMDWAARYYSQGAGVPRSKLLLAISTFGRNFTLLNPSDASLGAPAVGSGREVRGTQEEGFLAYYQICKRKGEKGRNSKQTTPYLVNKQEWISFDDPVSVREKADYVKRNGYGGVALWTPALDDFTGTSCGQGRYPLMTAVTHSLCRR